MTSFEFDARRRLWLQQRVITGVAAGSWMATTAWAQSAEGKVLRPTPAQTEGPYYPVHEPADADHDLLRNGNKSYTKGQAAWVEGTVVDRTGGALKGGVMEIWQCDENGHYDHPAAGSKMDDAFQGFGRVTLDAEGRFRFRTIRPARYTGRTPHIHAKIKLGRKELLTTQLYVMDEPGNARDGIWRRMSEADRALVTAPYVAGSDGFRARYQIVVQS